MPADGTVEDEEDDDDMDYKPVSRDDINAFNNDVDHIPPTVPSGRSINNLKEVDVIIQMCTSIIISGLIALFYYILFQILKTYIHAALHARWVLRCLKTPKYLQINETNKKPNT